jgi:hypothetical protein
MQGSCPFPCPFPCPCRRRGCWGVGSETGAGIVGGGGRGGGCRGGGGGGGGGGNSGDGCVVVGSGVIARRAGLAGLACVLVVIVVVVTGRVEGIDGRPAFRCVERHRIQRPPKTHWELSHCTTTFQCFVREKAQRNVRL